MTKEFYEKLGKKIKQLRLQNNIPRSKLALELGVSQQQIEKYEKGKNRLPIFRMKRLTALLGISVTDLLE